jgi:hypothetical protein
MRALKCPEERVGELPENSWRNTGEIPEKIMNPDITPLLRCGVPTHICPRLPIE